MTLNRPTRLIDQTPPHQIAVGMLLGAINCHDLLRVIKTEAHPFALPTDGMADMRGTADIVVSFDGGFQYGLAVEVKTTTQTTEGAGPFRLLKAVKGIERNTRQFERLTNSAPAWWYLVIHIGKLTAKTRSEMMRALLDCPAALFEGSRADQTPDEVWGVMPFGDLLDMVDQRMESLIKLAPAVAPLVAPLRQLDLLPVDDVPSVTMDTPLDVQTVWTDPRSASLRETDRACEWSIDAVYPAIIRAWDAIGDEEMTRRIGCETKLLDAYVRFRDEPASRNYLLTPCLIAAIRTEGMHNVIYLCMALVATREGHRLSRPRLMALFPEAMYALGSARRLRHLLPMITRQLAEP